MTLNSVTVVYVIMFEDENRQRSRVAIYQRMFP